MGRAGQGVPCRAAPSPLSRRLQVAGGDAAAGGGGEHPAVLQAGGCGPCGVGGGRPGGCGPTQRSRRGSEAEPPRWTPGGRGGEAFVWLEPGPGYKSAAESLGEPIKEKGSSHLLARLKGINGFYGIHPGMQIGALQAGIIARFV